MIILGISSFYHDSAAALVKDGDIIAAAQEERWTRKKHDARFPLNAIQYCLDEEGIDIHGVDLVVFYDKPGLKFHRIINTMFAFAPKGFSTFRNAVPSWLMKKLYVRRTIRRKLGYTGKIVFSDHHKSHASAAFYPSPFQKAAFLTVDGVGEWTTTAFGQGDGNTITTLKRIRYPHSLGMLYSAFTYFTGFKVNSGEYKMMGLAPYGRPVYRDKILANLVDVKSDGSFRLNMNYFDYCHGKTMTGKKFSGLFGGPPRTPESQITQREMDLAASIQSVTEEILLNMIRHIHSVTRSENLVLAGGVALNCVANGKILREGLFKNIWIQPASGDAGSALGAALWGWYGYLGNPRVSDGEKDKQKGSLLGPSFTENQITASLNTIGAVYKKMNDQQFLEAVTEKIDQGNVVGWFQGRMEFGPRALGSRSILGDARNSDIQSTMNLKIKYRESFRPFAPSVLEEACGAYFETRSKSPYMLIVSEVKKDLRIEPDGKDTNKGLLTERVKHIRSQIPAVTHVDYSARVQTVNVDDNPIYYKLLKTFQQRTGCAVIVNTSFNVRGEPIVRSPEDAYRCFMRTQMDYLAIGPFLLSKDDQPQFRDNEDWQTRYELD